MQKGLDDTLYSPRVISTWDAIEVQNILDELQVDELILKVRTLFEQIVNGSQQIGIADIRAQIQLVGSTNQLNLLSYLVMGLPGAMGDNMIFEQYQKYALIMEVIESRRKTLRIEKIIDKS